MLVNNVNNSLVLKEKGERTFVRICKLLHSYMKWCTHNTLYL